MLRHNISTIYSRYKRLTASQRSRLLASLYEQGIHIIDIEAYEYVDAPGIKHLFFYFSDASKTAVPYFLLDAETWATIQEYIMYAL